MPRTSALTFTLLLALGAAALPAAEKPHHAHHGAALPAAAAPASATPPTTAAARTPSQPLPADLRYGAAVPFGNGNARTLVGFDVQGKPTLVALSLTAGALEGLPNESPADDTGWLTRLPLPVGVALPPYDHVGLYWNPHGHEPHGVYDVSHFDVHFFMSTPQELDGITAMDRDLERVYNLPPAAAIPAGYILPPNTQHKRMGIHWVDTSAPELQGAPFTASLIVGSYDHQINFFEPMITRAFLSGKPNLTRPVPPAEGYTRAGWYPTTWSVRWDEPRGEYLVLLEGLRWQKATLPGTSLAESAGGATATGR